MKKITATDFYNYIQCKYRVYLEKFGDPKLKDKVSPFVRLLWERGIQHEEKVIEPIRERKDKTFAEIKKDQPADQKTFKETLQLMKKGFDYIYQGVLMNDNFSGRPDLLEKMEGSSGFGNYYYIPVDIKAGRGYEENNSGDRKIKEYYLFQLKFYGLILNKIQGFVSNAGKIINIDKEEIGYDLTLANDKFLKILNDISIINKGRELYQPIICGKCENCEWKNYCKKWAKDKNDLSLIFYVGENKYRLQEYGVKTIDDLLKLPLDSWLADFPEIRGKGYFKGIAEKSFSSLYKRAVVYKKGSEEISPAIKLLNSKKEIYFDIEDDPTQDITYLFGFWIVDRSNGQENYKYILAQGIDDEERAVNEAWDFFKDLDGIPVYHYASHEISILKRLQEKYKLPEEPFEILKRNAVDMYKVITDYTDWPLTSYGLKSICKFIGFKWSSEDAGGANSIEWFSKFLQGDKKMLEKILKYNEEDCRATNYLKDYLQKNAKSITQQS